MHQSSRYQSEHRKREYIRLRRKTPEEEFVGRLRQEFELSPRLSRGVLEVVAETFFDKQEIGVGQVRYTAVSREEGPGKSMEDLQKVSVVLTREVASDHETLERYGPSAMRRVQISRMCEEAFDQGALLTQEDLGRLLGVSSRTIRRDVEALMEQKVKLYLRGLQKDIGKGVSHKVWIVTLYLQWKTYSEIERITGHSVGAIKGYLNDFSRVVMAQMRGIGSPQEIGFYVGRTARLVEEYLALIREAQGDERMRSRLRSLKQQWRFLERQIPLKKGAPCMVWRLL